jgi:hypothetical protein
MNESEQLEFINDIRNQWSNEDILQFIKDIYRHGNYDGCETQYDFDDAFKIVMK